MQWKISISNFIVENSLNFGVSPLVEWGEKVLQLQLLTRQHSSRMRVWVATTRCQYCGGGFPQWTSSNKFPVMTIRCQWGRGGRVSRVCRYPGPISGVTLPCDLSNDLDTISNPPPCGQTYTCENITFLKLLLWVVINLVHSERLS